MFLFGESKAAVEHVLLMGMENSGKTKFLYETLMLNSNWYFIQKIEWSGEIKKTEGYNYEVIKNGLTEFGVWDLAGSP